MVVIDTSTDDGSSTQVGSQTRLRKYWQQTLRAPKPKPHTWSSFISRNGSVLFLAAATTGMIAWTSYFAFSYTNHPRELPMDTESGGQSIFALQVSTFVTALLLSELASACYERVRWQQASSSNGVLGGSLMGLSRGTSLAGVILLLVHPATHISSRLWCLNRIITYITVFLIPFVLLLGLSFPTVQFVQADFDPSLIVTTGWGDFNFSAIQEDVLGFDGFLKSSRETFPLPSSPRRCNDIGTADTSIDLCESHLLFTGLSNIQTYNGGNFQPLVKSSSYQSLATNAAGFMPWVESPWAVSFYQHNYNYTFDEGSECEVLYSPSLATSMNNDQVTGNDDWPAPPDFGAQVGMEICVASLDPDDFMYPGTVGTTGTTIVVRVSACGASCMGGDDEWLWKRGPPPRKQMFVAETSVSLSMTITKWFASPLYSTQNETVLSADLPLYTLKGMDQTKMLQNLGVNTNTSPRDYGSPIPTSIHGSDFRKFVLRPYLDVDSYGNLSDRFTLPNVLLNQIVETILLDTPDDAYDLMKDLLAYSLREGSIPISSDPLNVTPSLWSLQRARMQIFLPAFYLFVALVGAVALNCFIILFWTSITDRASSTTLYPEVDFGAGFMSGHGRDNELGRIYNSSTVIASTSSQVYDDLPGYDPDPPTLHPPVDRRRNMSQDDFLTQTQEQVDLVSKLRRVHSGRVVHRMAQATFKVADLS